MSFDELVSRCVRDAVMQAGYDRAETVPVLKEREYAIVKAAVSRFNDQLTFNHLRDLMRQRKPKS